MPRLPIPGSDSGQWGGILNEFLTTAHNTNGSLKANSVGAAQVQDGSLPVTKLDSATQNAISSAASGVAPDATTTTKGVVRLAGDLSGTALTPTIAAGAVTGGASGSIASGTIIDSNIHTTANIAKSKLAPLAITDSDVASSAAIAQSKISGLSTSLAGKANSSHTHNTSDINGLQGQLDDKATVIHVHSQSDVTGLTSALSGKANTSHTHTASQVTDLNQYVSDALGNKIIAGSNVSVSYDAISGETTISSIGGGGGGAPSDTVTTVAGRTGDVVLVAGDITGGTFASARIPNLDTSKITTGSLDIARIPTGTTSSTVALGNHTHDTTYAPLVHTHGASDVNSGTFNIARIPTGTSGTTVALGNHTHDSSYAAVVHTHDDRYYTESEIDASLAAKLDANQKGAANGVATLGADSKIPSSQLPALAINDTFTATNQSAMLALAAQRGDVCIRTDTNKTYILSTDNPGTLADWKEMVASGQVTSVNGSTGTVSLTAASVGAASATHTHAISDVANLQTQLSSFPIIVKWVSGTGWGTYSTSTSAVRYFHSQNDAAATAPTYYSPYDMWYRHPEAS